MAPPDVAMISGGANTLKILTSANLLLPLDDYANQYKWSSREDGIRVGSSLYGLSSSVELVAMLYNRDVFGKLGLQAPGDWETLTDDLDTIKAGGYIPVTFGAKDGALDNYSALVEANSDIGDLTPLLRTPVARPS